MTTDNGHALLRQCLGQFATGITVVTCRDASDRPVGITANSFSSVSLEPPLVLWSIAKSSNSLSAFLEASHFVIHVLSAAQKPLSEHFARTDHTRFEGIDYAMSDENVPVLPGCIATLHCSGRQVVDGGDHHIVLGQVDRFDTGEGDPLLYFGGDYRMLSDPG